MDFGIRELLILIGAIFFIAIIADAVRRFLENRKKQLKLLVKPGANDVLGDEDDIDWFSGELPAGGARSRNKDGAGEGTKESRQENNNFFSNSEQAFNKNQTSKSASKFTEPFDILMEGSKNRQASVKTESLPDMADNDQGCAIDSARDSEGSVDYRNPQPVYANDNPATQKQVNENSAAQASRKAKEKNQRDLFKEPVDSELVVSESSKSLPEEIISINVMAKVNGQIEGAELLEALIAFGLRFGDMNIFHRHELSSGQGPVIFSMANALNPGTFDLEAMPQIQFKGVTFFMRLSQIKKRVFVLELMLDIAKRLANQLNAELKDDTHSVLSSQTVSHYKTRIQEYERRYLGQVLRNDN